MLNSLSQRKKFALAREKERDAASHEAALQDIPAGCDRYRCKNGWCGGYFIARKADRKRGWARFCSKSCKAQHQG